MPLNNADMGTFQPKDVDLNEDEEGCPTCHNSGTMPLVGTPCVVCNVPTKDNRNIS